MGSFCSTTAPTIHQPAPDHLLSTHLEPACHDSFRFSTRCWWWAWYSWPFSWCSGLDKVIGTNVTRRPTASATTVSAAFARPAQDVTSQQNVSEGTVFADLF